MKDTNRYCVYNNVNDMNENEIKEILLNGENVTLECKRAKSDVPKSVWETCSTFCQRCMWCDN